jgi:hypothetical protein
LKLLGKPLEILSIGENKGDIGLNEKFFEDTKIRINLHLQKIEKKQCVFMGHRKVYRLFTPRYNFFGWRKYSYIH